MRSFEFSESDAIPPSSKKARTTDDFALVITTSPLTRRRLTFAFSHFWEPAFWYTTSPIIDLMMTFAERRGTRVKAIVKATREMNFFMGLLTLPDNYGRIANC